jgi:hypothetical protein
LPKKGCPVEFGAGPTEHGAHPVELEVRPAEQFPPPPMIWGAPRAVRGPPREVWGAARGVWGAPRETFFPPRGAFSPPAAVLIRGKRSPCFCGLSTETFPRDERYSSKGDITPPLNNDWPISAKKRGVVEKYF